MVGEWHLHKAVRNPRGIQSSITQAGVSSPSHNSHDSTHERDRDRKWCHDVQKQFELLTCNSWRRLGVGRG